MLSNNDRILENIEVKTPSPIPSSAGRNFDLILFISIANSLLFFIFVFLLTIRSRPNIQL